MAIEDSGNSSTWSREQEKAFENALADYSDEDGNHRWEKIAADVPGKTVDDIKKHFELLLEDINGIESGRVPLPYYISSSEGSIHHRGDGGKKVGNHHSDSHTGGKPPRSEQERRRGIAWTEDEHRLFLLGLEKYGKGDWRSISRNFVLSRTPTQVASHAQKYFIRLNSMNKDRRRSSIHDITSICSGESYATQEPITGTSGTAVVPSRRPGKQPPNHPPAIAGVGIYGTPTIGQPTRAPIASAVGTPVHVPAQPCIAYDGRGPAVGKVVSSASSISAPTVCPMQHASAYSHR